MGAVSHPNNICPHCDAEVPSPLLSHGYTTTSAAGGRLNPPSRQTTTCPGCHAGLGRAVGHGWHLERIPEVDPDRPATCPECGEPWSSVHTDTIGSLGGVEPILNIVAITDYPHRPSPNRVRLELRCPADHEHVAEVHVSEVSAYLAPMIEAARDA